MLDTTASGIFYPQIIGVTDLLHTVDERIIRSSWFAVNWCVQGNALIDIVLDGRQVGDNYVATRPRMWYFTSEREQ